MELVKDIPRLYTGIAEWAGCIVILLLCRRKMKTGWFVLVSMAALLVQCGVLVITADVDAGITWVSIMFLAIFVQFFFIALCADIPLRGAIYCTSAAFLHAEFAASLEWQLHTWMSRHFPIGDRWLLILIVVYTVVFLYFFYNSRRHITEDFLKSLTRQEVMSVIMIALLTFVFSNLSFIIAGSPFSGRVMEDIFTIRTLADGFGIAVFAGLFPHAGVLCGAYPFGRCEPGVLFFVSEFVDREVGDPAGVVFRADLDPVAVGLSEGLHKGSHKHLVVKGRLIIWLRPHKTGRQRHHRPAE